jgi:pyruvate dehydrogenase E2 component (dihydrolipoamide acetyltransferase)
MGGAIATQFALTHPQRTASLTLICSAGLGQEINTGYTDGFIAASNKRELKTVVEQLFSNPELVTRSLVDDLLKYKRMDGVPEALAELGQSLFSQGKQTETPGLKLQGNTPPVLVIWGAQDQIIPAQHAANAPAGATVAVLDGAGHMVMLEKANEVNALIKKHVAAH